MMIRYVVRVMLGVALAGLIFVPAMAQQMYIYPTQNQSPDQQSRDRYECHIWAVQQTGVDPTNPQMAAAPPQQAAQQGGLLRGAARGATVGVVVGAIGGNAGKGAAIGAVRGALFGGLRRREQQRRIDALGGTPEAIFAWTAIVGLHRRADEWLGTVEPSRIGCTGHRKKSRDDT